MKRLLSPDPVRYVLKEDRERQAAGEDVPVFILRPLKAKDAARVQDQIAQASSSDGSVKILTGTRQHLCLKLGLIGWENVEGADGQPVEFKTEPIGGYSVREAASDNLLDLLPGAVRTELVDALDGDLTAEELGN